uniref:FxsA family protein n=1 Tax=Ningiella ruwaisensis TaxID=2364274 RepID=UPI0010A0111F|nr:FxsA family protein [Ningiella ruwaisensis]
MLFLFILFVVLPISEIMLIINVSDTIGGWNTFFIVIATAFIGAFFVKREGLQTLQNVQLKTAKGELPGKEISEGLLLLIAGVLLVTPGFITDIIGLLFTLPFTRAPIAAALVKQFVAYQVKNSAKNSAKDGGFTFTYFEQRTRYSDDERKHQNGSPSGSSSSSASRGETIDGEYQDKTPSDNADADNRNDRLN